MAIALHLATNLMLATVVFAALWYVSLRKGDPSFVDAFWAFTITAIGLSSFAMAHTGWMERKLVLTGLALIWGLRLGIHLFTRWRREGKDRRYVKLIGGAMKKRGWSYGRATALYVFIPQALLAWVVSLPLQLGQFSPVPEGFGLIGLFGFALAVFGIGYEALADHQLHRFRADPANEGRVMDQGLWSWSRHPNYFGEICVWWGLWLVAAETAPGLFAVLSPLFVTFTLVFWSGRPLMKKALLDSRPGYADYAARTSALIPRPPRRGDAP
jgi:steroid 5-alpha reductase family enzyme